MGNPQKLQKTHCLAFSMLLLHQWFNILLVVIAVRFAKANSVVP